MGYNYYNYTVYLETRQAQTLKDVKEVLNNFTISEATDSSLTLSFDGWKMWIHFASGADIETEAAEMAELTGKPEIAECGSRLEIYAEDDPDETHYHDHLGVIDFLSELADCHVYDPVLGSFIFEEPITTPDIDFSFLDQFDRDKKFVYIIARLRSRLYDVDLWDHLLDLAEEAENRELEMHCYRVLIALETDNYVNHHNLGILHRDNNDFDQAEPYFRKVTELNPDFSDAWTDLGKIHFRRNQKEEGIICIERAIDADPFNELPYINAGYYLIKLEDLKLSLHYSEEGIKRGEEYCCVFNKGHVHFLQGETELAMQSYKRSLELAGSQKEFLADYKADFKLFSKYKVTREEHDALLPSILK